MALLICSHHTNLVIDLVWENTEMLRTGFDKSMPKIMTILMFGKDDLPRN